MIKKPLQKVFFCTISFLVLPATVFALGFGEITVFSKLNEPLKVHIELLDSQSALLDEIIVQDAEMSAYRRANLPKPQVFNKVQFNARKEANGVIIVELTSKRPIREPFITFIADMRWPKGHLNQEYTFLLDPPEFIKKHSRPAARKKSIKKSLHKTATRKTITKAKTSTLRPSQGRQSQKIDHSAVIAAHVSENSYGPTKRADTLWDIARRVKPDNNVTTYQTMQALFVLNPDAFIKGNINLLKQGETLTIPSHNEILQINGKAPLQKAAKKPGSLPRQKETALNKQNNKAKSSSKTVEQPSDPEKQLTSKAEEKSEEKGEARLKIIPPPEDLINKQITSQNDLSLINRALKTSISTIKVLQNQNTTLSEQVNNLTDKLNRLDSHNIELNNKISEITNLLKNRLTDTSPSQNNLKEQRDDTQLKEQSGDAQAVDLTVDKKIPADTASLKIDSPLAKREEKPQSFVRELLTSPYLTMALAVILIIILAAKLITIRKEKSKRKYKKLIPLATVVEPDDTNTSRSENSQSNESSETIPVPEQEPRIKDEKNEDDMDFFEYFEKKINTPDDMQSSNNAPENTKPDNEQSSALNEADTINTDKEAAAEAETESNEELMFDLDISDEEIEEYEQSISHAYENLDKRTSTDKILSEVDTYIAYGRNDKAEQLLHSLIEASPSDKNLHLKLLECYTHENKRVEFMEHLQKIINILNVDMVLRRRVESIYQKTWNESLNINKLT